MIEGNNLQKTYILNGMSKGMVERCFVVAEDMNFSGSKMFVYDDARKVTTRDSGCKNIDSLDYKQVTTQCGRLQGHNDNQDGWGGISLTNKNMGENECREKHLGVHSQSWNYEARSSIKNTVGLKWAIVIFNFLKKM